MEGFRPKPETRPIRPLKRPSGRLVAYLASVGFAAAGGLGQRSPEVDWVCPLNVRMNYLVVSLE